MPSLKLIKKIYKPKLLAIPYRKTLIANNKNYNVYKSEAKEIRWLTLTNTDTCK